MKLRVSQIETLRRVREFEEDFGEGIDDWALARRLDRSRRSAAGRLERLCAWGILSRKLESDGWDFYAYSLTNEGRSALQQADKPVGGDET
jgi:predicted DNA-binding transcriptional regulator